MGRTRASVSLLLLSLVLLPGCVVSSQDGERAHVDAKHPDEIAFHFDTGFNKFLVIGRSGMLLLIAAWLVFRPTGGPNTVPILLGVALTGLAAWLAFVGFTRIGGYRIEVSEDALHWQAPGRQPLDLPWAEIEGLEVEGMWEDLVVYHVDGRIFDADLRPLSVEQRGTLWGAIARKSEVPMGKPQLLPARN